MSNEETIFKVPDITNMIVNASANFVEKKVLFIVDQGHNLIFADYSVERKIMTLVLTFVRQKVKYIQT